MTDHVYLAGPITGLTYEEGQDWRAEMVERFAGFGIEARSPLRGKGYLRDYGKLDDTANGKQGYIGVHPLSEPPGIVTRDRNDCRTAGVVLANVLGAVAPSLGTVMECAWADAYRVPLVLVAEEGNIHRHAMIAQVAGYITDDLEVAFDITLTTLGINLDTAKMREVART
jgi:hypothetical protein